MVATITLFLSFLDDMVNQNMVKSEIKYNIVLGCSKSFESDIYRAVEEPKFLRHFKISSFI